MTDTRVIDVLLLKGRQEYQETLNCWKQLDHIMGILLAPRGRPQRTFLQKFYEGACRRLRSVCAGDDGLMCVRREGRGRGAACCDGYRAPQGCMTGVESITFCFRVLETDAVLHAPPCRCESLFTDYRRMDMAGLLVLQ